MSLFSDWVEIRKDNKERRFNEAVNKKVKKIMATNEGSHSDILNSLTTRSISTEPTQKKNQYKTYASAINAIYDMYNGEKDYGGEFIKGVLKTRIAFIAGGGVTVIAEKASTEKWIVDFLKYNKMLEGSNLFKYVLTSEMEGKTLLILKRNRNKTNIDVRCFQYYKNPYKVNMDDKDDQMIKSITYKSENETKQEDIAKVNELIYIKIGGSPDRVEETMPVIGNCLTDIENASRIKYDLRYNNHLYGRLTPAFKTSDMNEAKALLNRINSTNWKIGKAYVGTAEFKIVGPPPGATEALTSELITACRIISMNTGIPIHWLAWPDLMSNRSTAENMMEAVNAATILEREIWEEGIEELIKKAMEMAVILGIPGAVNDPDGFEIKLPLISEATLNQIQNTWIPLADGGYITQDSVRNKIPGINPNFEKRMLKKQTEERLTNIKNKFNNNFDSHTHQEDEDEIDMEVEDDE